MGLTDLPTSFTGRGEVRGFEFLQLARNEKAYLYQVTTAAGTHYEVFERKIDTRFGKVSYPRAQAFGVWAVSIRDRAQAWALFVWMSGMGLDTGRGRSPVIRRYARQIRAVSAPPPAHASTNPSK